MEYLSNMWSVEVMKSKETITFKNSGFEHDAVDNTMTYKLFRSCL